MENIQKRINKIKLQKNAVILAHYYQPKVIQDIADYVGDSFALSKIAKNNDYDIILFCGVRFMAESAKLLSPSKKVLLPIKDADCPMANMVSPEDIEEMKLKYPNAAVVCYINSTVQVKAVSDICCTSSNAVKVVKSLKEDQIIFVPDHNLARFVAANVPEKEIIPHKGYCYVHQDVTIDQVDRALKEHSDAALLAHPECSEDVLKKAQFIGSTAGIIKYVSESNENEFLIATDTGILNALLKSNPNKHFHMVYDNMNCKDMKKTTIEDVLLSLENEQFNIEIDKTIAQAACISIERMLSVK